ncbi:thiamine-phosphate kinase [Rosenbergiella collisarenosi]|uniref:thiamine-phosphate kinase n=1 Tax=Rosenbergiella collisarenosi TaxID=1544695 RepID=UPI001BDA5435|nr:thiamine-phosphate kinase [Rosenbergiella collisarenosi]MBT0721553.1 thiamine-phosphate kinase [Rosenbergiella collisarenosi]
MADGEFEIISRYFNRKTTNRRDVETGIGDDCALLNLAPNQTLAISVDTLVEGTHFYPDIAPDDLAYKALAVNLSDLAAMGADPAWLTLAISLPHIDHQWLQAFSDALFEQLDYYHMQLIGGDTTRGPLSMTLGIHGVVPAGKALKRSGAQRGDWIFVTGTLGDSAAGLALLQNTLTAPSLEQRNYLLKRHLRPTPRILPGQALRHLASAAIDISDGLLSDLGHILQASGVGAKIEQNQLPLSSILQEVVGREAAIDLALNGGEDYELCFTVPEVNREAIQVALNNLGVEGHCIGQILPASEGIALFDNGKKLSYRPKGFDHFAG